MASILHANARTTPPASNGRSRRPPHRLCTTLTNAQKQVVVTIRELLLLPLDDLLVMVWEFIEPVLSRSALDRCLRRHGVSNLKILQAALETTEGEEQKPPKDFKQYEPGFVHIDVKYLPQLQQVYNVAGLDTGSPSATFSLARES